MTETHTVAALIAPIVAQAAAAGAFAEYGNPLHTADSVKIKAKEAILAAIPSVYATAARALEQAASELDVRFAVDRIVLFRSILGGGPARYEPLHEALLGAGDGPRG